MTRRARSALTPELGRVGRAIAAMVLVVTLAGCGIGTQAEPTKADRSLVPPELLEDRGSSAPPTTLVTAAATVYLVHSDRLVGTQRELPAPVSATARLTALTRGPEPVEAAAGLGTALPGRDILGNVREGGGAVLVELTASLADLGATQRLLCVAQIVLTAVGDDPAAQVSFTFEGEALAVPLPDGTLTQSPVDRTTYDELIAAR